MTSPLSRRLATVAFTLGLSGFASAQISGSDYSIAPFVGSTATGVAEVFAVGLQNSEVNQLTEVIGTTPSMGADVRSTDALTDLGNDTFRLELRVVSTDNLVPIGWPAGGAPSDRAGLILGQFLPGGLPVEFPNERAAFISSAEFSVFNLDGTRMAPPSDALPAFAGLNDPEFFGGWDGSVLLQFSQSQLTGPVGGFELVVYYRLGVGADYNQILNSGCESQGLITPLLEPISPTVLGLPMTFEVSSISTPNLIAVSLLLDLTANGNGINFGVFGAPQCTLRLDNPFFALPMSISGAQAQATIDLPNDLSLAGLELALQAIGIASDGSAPITGLFLSNLGLLTVGG